MEIIQLGQIAGIAGITIGLMSIIFQIVLKKKIFPIISSDHAYKIIRLIIVLSFVMGVMGILAWIYLESPPPHNQ